MKYQYFAHRDCEYFPCHPGANSEKFNCLFCYCPLYALGSDCGGNFSYTADRAKDCSACLYPHAPENYEKIVGRLEELLQK